MQEIIEECTLEGVALLNHANSFLIIVISNNWNIQLRKTNESLQSILRLYHVDDDLGNSMCNLKDWHETMLSYNFVRKKKTHD